MKRLALLLVVCLTAPVWALDAGSPAPLDAGVAVAVAPAPVVPAPAVDAGIVAPAPAPALDNPTAFIKIIFTSVKTGNWWAAAAALLVVIVSLLRTYGRKLHDKLDDKNPLDKVFWAIFDTKAGGLLLNIATAVAGGVGTALLAGEPVNWSLLKPILIVAGTGSALWEIGKDLFSFIQKKAVPTDSIPPPPITKP